MSEIRLSVMSWGPSTEARWRALLEDFERRTQVHVHVEVMPWQNARSDLIGRALDTSGFDVSEVGSTWISDMAPIGALRPFGFLDIAELGGADAYLPAAWRTTRLADDDEVWAVPWVVDPLVLHYRRDLLARAGLDEAGAFRSYAQIAETLAGLQRRGVATPWAAPFPQGQYNGLHVAACWIWNAGGDILDARGLHVQFDQPAARAGLCGYYDLARYANPEAPNNTLYSTALGQGTAALAVAGAWFPFFLAGPLSAELEACLGAVPLPGKTFLGGTHLVVWANSRAGSAALELVQALTQSTGQAHYAAETGYLPARLSAWESEECSSTALWRARQTAALAGAAFPNTRLLGMVEHKLAEALDAIWADVFAERSADLDTLIAGRLTPLARKLNIALSALQP